MDLQEQGQLAKEQRYDVVPLQLEELASQPPKKLAGVSSEAENWEDHGEEVLLPAKRE